MWVSVCVQKLHVNAQHVNTKRVDMCWCQHIARKHMGVCLCQDPICQHTTRRHKMCACVFMSTHCKKACGCLFMSTHYTSAHCKQKCGCLFVSTHFQVQRHCVCLQCVVVPCIPRCITLYHLVSRWHQHITTQTHTAHVPNLNTLQRTAPSYSKAHLSNLKSHTLLANKHLPNPQAQQALQLSAAGPTYWYECPPSFLCHVTYSQRRKELINYMWVSGRVAANAARPACRCTR